MNDDLSQFPVLLTVEQVAQVWKVGVPSVRRWCRLGLIDCVRLGRNWRIPADEVRRVIREGVPMQPMGPKRKQTRPAADVVADLGRSVHRGDQDQDEVYRPPADQLGLELQA